MPQELADSKYDLRRLRDLHLERADEDETGYEPVVDDWDAFWDSIGGQRVSWSPDGQWPTLRPIINPASHGAAQLGLARLYAICLAVYFVLGVASTLLLITVAERPPF
jgi:hypothetical protein